MESEHLSARSDNLDDDAIVLVTLRNDFYRTKYHTIFAIHVLSWCLIVFLCLMISYIIKHPRSPYFFATDNATRFVKTIPVQQPDMTTADVINWTGEAIRAAMSYDYVNYRDELQSAQKYFTDFGWHTYMQGLSDSLNLVALTERKQVVIASLAGPGEVLAEGPLGATKAYGWKIAFPVLTTYMTPPYDNVQGKSVFQNPLTVTIIVQRQDELSSYKGLGIVQLIATVPS